MNHFLDLTLGQGYQVWRVLLIAFGVVLIGAFAFGYAHSTGNMMLLKGSEPQPDSMALCILLTFSCPLSTCTEKGIGCPLPNMVPIFSWPICGSIFIWGGCSQHLQSSGFPYCEKGLRRSGMKKKLDCPRLCRRRAGQPGGAKNNCTAHLSIAYNWGRGQTFRWPAHLPLVALLLVDLFDRRCNKMLDPNKFCSPSNRQDKHILNRSH